MNHGYLVCARDSLPVTQSPLSLNEEQMDRLLHPTHLERGKRHFFNLPFVNICNIFLPACKSHLALSSMLRNFFHLLPSEDEDWHQCGGALVQHTLLSPFLPFSIWDYQSCCEQQQGDKSSLMNYFQGKNSLWDSYPSHLYFYEEVSLWLLPHLIQHFEEPCGTLVFFMVWNPVALDFRI